jgi:hypothetical protein
MLEHDEQPHRGVASATARATVAAVPAVPTPPAVLVVSVVGLIAERTTVPDGPVVPRLQLR